MNLTQLVYYSRKQSSFNKNSHQKSANENK